MEIVTVHIISLSVHYFSSCCCQGLHSGEFPCQRALYKYLTSVNVGTYTWDVKTGIQSRTTTRKYFQLISLHKDLINMVLFLGFVYEVLML